MRFPYFLYLCLRIFLRRFLIKLPKANPPFENKLCHNNIGTQQGRPTISCPVLPLNPTKRANSRIRQN